MILFLQKVIFNVFKIWIKFYDDKQNQIFSTLFGVLILADKFSFDLSEIVCIVWLGKVDKYPTLCVAITCRSNWFNLVWIYSHPTFVCDIESDGEIALFIGHVKNTQVTV